VLSADEQKVFDELVRHHTEESGDLGPSRSLRTTPGAFIVLWWVSILTVILGQIVAGLAIAAVVGLAWLLWRHLPALGDLLESASEVADAADDRDPR
jgi:Flp pilus assembly protein TadB